MGNAGAMVNLVRSAARDQERIVANSPKGAVRWKEAGKLGIVTLKGVEVGGAESGHRAKRGRSQKLKDTRNQSACSIKKRTKQARGRESSESARWERAMSLLPDAQFEEN
jgi:hypothetical protein